MPDECPSFSPWYLQDKRIQTVALGKKTLPRTINTMDLLQIYNQKENQNLMKWRQQDLMEMCVWTKGAKPNFSVLMQPQGRG